MATHSNFDSSAISTGIAVGDIFADLETQMIINRKAVFEQAKRDADWRQSVYAQFRAYREANSLAVQNALAEAAILAGKDVRKAHSVGRALTDDALNHYTAQGYRVPEGQKNALNPSLLSALATVGGTLVSVANYAKQAAEMQLIQIASIVNPNTDDINAEIDRAQGVLLQKGIPGASVGGAEKEMSGQVEYAVRDGTHKALLNAEGERASEYGLDLILISAHPSSCPLCLPWQGRILVNNIFGNGVPDGKHELASVAQAAGLWHYNCYDKETEVLTSEGWKLFKALNKTELVYTLNPETRCPEWQKPTAYYEKHHDGQMVFLHNNTNSLMVTPDHNLLYYSQKLKHILRFREAVDYNTDTHMYAGAEWQGITPEYVELAEKRVAPELYCKLMAYWLADGSLHGNGSAIKIAQQNNQWMYDELKELPFNVWRDNDKIVIRNGGGLEKHFKKFGTCTQKYVPDEIKALSKDLIKAFLLAYSKTDGYVFKSNSLDGYKSNYCTQLFTTSERMAADLGELALKAGYRPSYYKRHDKGKQVKFKNGTYVTNNDIWTINLRNHVNVGLLKKEVIPYADMVYCVEVPKYHTLLIRRKGKVLWCGNCRHTYIVYIPGYDKPDFYDRDKRDVKTTAEIYAVEQQQRYNERMIREWKRREAGSMSETTRLNARLRVQEWQARQRALRDLAQERGLPFYRQYSREQVGGETKPNLPDVLTNHDQNDIIISRNPASGRASAIRIMGADLNKRQQVLVERLNKSGDAYEASKNQIKTKDVASLTAKENVEFTIFSKGDKRLIVRGDSARVPLSASKLKALADDGWKWTAHSHIGDTAQSLSASEGDMKVLYLFKQNRSAIYNSKGEFSVFYKG